MPKGGLTGGTGDVNPQIYRIQVPNGVSVTTTSVSNGSATQAYPIPVSRLRQGNGKATVMEILKVRWVNQVALAVNQAPHNAYYVINSWLSTKAPGSVGIPTSVSPFSGVDGGVIDQASVTNAVGVAASGLMQSASYDNETPNYHDLTDSNGHGILVATDNIWISIMLQVGSIDAVSYTASGFSACHIIYRFKDVSLQEYIGIVQSQQ